MSIQPYSSFIGRTDVFSSQPAALSNETIWTSSLFLPPDIVNQQALELATRQRIEEFTSQDVFDALHSYLDGYPPDIPPPFKEIVKDFKSKRNGLYNWILQNGSTVKEEVARYGRSRDRYIAKNMQEVLYWLPLAASKNTPLHPETILACLWRFLFKEGGTKEVSLKLLRSQNFLNSILNIPASDLQKQGALFIAHDTIEVRQLFLEALCQVYLNALQQRGVMHQVQMLENNFDGETRRNFERSKTSYWNNFVEKECFSWGDVKEGLDRILQKPLPEDFYSLQAEECHIRAVSCELSALQSLLSLEENPLRDHLLFIVQHAFKPDQPDPLFPDCLVNLPQLFNSLSQCRSTLSLLTYLHQFSLRLEKCQNKKLSTLSFQTRTVLDNFFFNYNHLIFDTAIRLLYDCVKGSLHDYSNWPTNLKDALIETLKQTPCLDLEEWWELIEYDQELRTQFIHLLSSKYVDKDPTEWMKEKISQLGNALFQALSDVLEVASPQQKSEVLYRYLSLKGKLPRDLMSFRTWCNSNLRAPL